MVRILVITLGPIAVVFAIALWAALNTPAEVEAARVDDADNLRGLAKAWADGLAADARGPANAGVSEGAQFWIALYTGDGADEPSEPLLTPDDAGLLISPADRYFDADSASAAIARSVSTAQRSPAVFVDGKIVCSYNGPTIESARKLGGQQTVIGCTGDRDGRPLFDKGTNLLFTDLRVVFTAWRMIGYYVHKPVPARPSAQTFVATQSWPFKLDATHVVD